MKIIIKLVILICAFSLTGCCGIFESKTCGIKNSQWEKMSYAEQLDIERSYNEKQRVAEQIEVNKIILKQQKKLAKIRRNNEKAQMKRMQQERDQLEKQQRKIEADLELKQQAYVPIDAQ